MRSASPRLSGPRKLSDFARAREGVLPPNESAPALNATDSSSLSSCGATDRVLMAPDSVGNSRCTCRSRIVRPLTDRLALSSSSGGMKTPHSCQSWPSASAIPSAAPGQSTSELTGGFTDAIQIKSAPNLSPLDCRSTSDRPADRWHVAIAEALRGRTRGSVSV